MSFLAIKHFHIFCVSVSICGFLLRGWWMMADSPLLRSRWARVAPHLVDTCLLGSALVLVWQSGQYPGQDAWLSAKVGGLLAYIALGTLALKRGRTRFVRVSCFVGAVGVFGWMVSVALTRNPAGFIGLSG